MRTKIEIGLCLLAALLIVALSFAYRKGEAQQTKGFEPVPDCAPGIVDSDRCLQHKPTMR